MYDVNLLIGGKPQRRARLAPRSNGAIRSAAMS